MSSHVSKSKRTSTLILILERGPGIRGKHVNKSGMCQLEVVNMANKSYNTEYLQT